MTEQIYTMSSAEKHVIEPVIKDENLHYMHMVLKNGEALPVHTTNATVYMTVVQGNMTLRLNGEAPAEYKERTVLKIPLGVKMDAKNLNAETLELFVVKAPAPSSGA